MNQLTALAGSFVGGKVFKHINLPRLLKVFIGDTPSTKKEAETAELFLNFTENSDLSSAFVEVAFDALRGRGIDENEVFRLIGNYAPFVGIDPPKSREHLVSAARFLARRVVDKKLDETIVHHATVVCPQCKYVHAI